MTLQQWFQKFTQREQIYLLGAAAGILLYLMLVAVWQPLADKRSEMETRNIQVSQQLVRVQAMASELQQLQSAGGKQSKRNMNQLINNSTNKFGIRPTRIQPNSRGETQIRFENVGFTPLLRWLNQIENSEGVLVHEVAINQGDRGGVVKATIRLGQGS
jgi:general secretion pathway protein M